MLKRLTAFIALIALSVPAGWCAGETIVVVGDSLSSGYGLSAEQSWVAMLAERLKSEGYGHQVVNASIAGDTSAGGLARLPRLLEMHDPDWVVIERRA
jgi:acyl-CoA thioesterase-1